MPVLRIATRKSLLALWQTQWVTDLLNKAHPGLEIEWLELVTQGDLKLESSLAKIGGKGLFLKELEEALLDMRADLAVHSLKDVPMELDPNFRLAAYLPRATALDALCAQGATLDSLPPQAVVGTSSLRRQAQLLAIRPDLNIKLIRGNVDTRLKKLQAGDYDAITLAACGLERLNLSEHISEYLHSDICLPAIGQGIVVIETRSDDIATQDLVRALHDTTAASMALAERSLGAALHSSCQVPVAGYAEIIEGRLQLRAWVGTPDGQKMLYAQDTAAVQDAVTLGLQVAQQLKDAGAQEIIDRCLSG
jgi:hydroxymethylbilane synthase